MGIPVIYFGEAGNDRHSIVTDVGLPFHVRDRNAGKGLLRWFNEDVDWTGHAPDVNAIGEAIRAEVARRLEAAAEEPRAATAAPIEASRI